MHFSPRDFRSLVKSDCILRNRRKFKSATGLFHSLIPGHYCPIRAAQIPVRRVGKKSGTEVWSCRLPTWLVTGLRSSGQLTVVLRRGAVLGKIRTSGGVGEAVVCFITLMACCGTTSVVMSPSYVITPVLFNVIYWVLSAQRFADLRTRNVKRISASGGCCCCCCHGNGFADDKPCHQSR